MIHGIYSILGFPSDFIPVTDDEGLLFQLDVRKKKIIPTFLFPKNHIFEDLIIPLKSFLMHENININLNQNVDQQFLKNFLSNRNSKSINIWSASSFELLRIFDSEFALSLLNNKRHIHLLLFSKLLKTSNFGPKSIKTMSQKLYVDER